MEEDSDEKTEEDNNKPTKNNNNNSTNVSYDDLLDEIDEIKNIEKDNHIFKTRKRIQLDNEPKTSKKIKSRNNNNNNENGNNINKQNNNNINNINNNNLNISARKENKNLSPNSNILSAPSKKRDNSLSPKFKRDNSLSPYSSEEQTQLLDNDSPDLDSTQLIIGEGDLLKSNTIFIGNNENNIYSNNDRRNMNDNNNHRNPNNNHKSFSNHNNISTHTVNNNNNINYNNDLMRNNTVLFDKSNNGNNNIDLQTTQRLEDIENIRTGINQRSNTIIANRDNSKFLERNDTLPFKENQINRNADIFDDPYSNLDKDTIQCLRLRRIDEINNNMKNNSNIYRGNTIFLENSPNNNNIMRGNTIYINNNNSLNTTNTLNRTNSNNIHNILNDPTQDMDSTIIMNNNNNCNNNGDNNHSTLAKGITQFMDGNDFDSGGNISGMGESSSIANFNSFITQKPLKRNETIHSFDSEAVTQNINLDEKSSGSFFNSKENLEAFINKSQEFEFPKKRDNSGEFHQTKKFPPDKFVCMDGKVELNFSESEESPRPIDRQETVPINILKKDTLSKIGILKSNSSKYGDVWIIYDDLSVESHDNVGSNFLMFGRSSENQNMTFTFHKISSKHCKIYVVKNNLKTKYEYEVWIEDTSSNGTYINRELVGKGNKKLLKPDDTLHLYIPKTSEEDEEISYVLKEMIIDDISLNPNCKLTSSSSIINDSDPNNFNITNYNAKINTNNILSYIPPCVYGKECFNNNVEHRNKFYHPK